jgi:ADP-L-glycero-D-manno-heptose 6-epimerase
VFKFGEQKRDFVYIEDVLQANLQALEKRTTGVFNVGSGSAGSFNQIIWALNQTLGTQLDADYFDNPYSFTQDHTQADIAAAHAALGYTPRFDLAAGIAHYHQTGGL